MNTLHPTERPSYFIHLANKLHVIAFLLTLFFTFTAVPATKADLPPETYYQGINTGVNGDDVGSAALPIGFDFTFFGNNYSEFYVSSNGYISFEDRDLTDFSNDDISDRTNPDDYIAPFWDDLTVYNASGEYIYYQTIGTAPNRQLVVQFTNVGFWSDPTPLGTFSVILYEGSNNIQFQYRYLVGDSARTHGASATVGLENDKGKQGTKFSYNTESLASEQVILFTPNGDNYDVGSAPYAAILLGAGATVPPDSPVQTAPLNGSTISQTPTFSWEASANADWYELRVDNNPNMGSLSVHETGITGTSFTPSTPLPEDTYYWIVIAHNADDSSWSEQWSFTTSSNPPLPLPDTPLLTAPAQVEADVSLSPTFSWQTTPAADSYQLLVSENADLSAPIIDQSGIVTTSYDASGLAPDTTYYWSVIAGNATGSSQSSTRSFSTLHVNTPPTANDDNKTVAEDSGTTSIDVLDNDSDPDAADTLSVTDVGTLDNGGTAVINNNQIEYTPASNFFGTEVFTYTISDGNGGSDSATVTINVTAVNDTPTANDDNETVAEDSGTTSIDVLDNDSDPDATDTLSVSAVGTPDNGGTAVINNNQIEYTAAPSFVGSETFTYTVSDGRGGTDSALVTITVYVSSSNAAPNANNDSPETLEDSPLIIHVLENDDDPDGDSLSILAVGEAGHGTAVIQSSSIKYTPDANFHGSDRFTYTVGDGEFTDVAIVNITIVSVNDLPQATLDSAATNAGTEVVVRVLENDNDPIEGSHLTIVSVANPAHGTATTNGTTITYRPDNGFVGIETFTYTMSDGTDSVTGTVTVTINPYQLFIPLVIK